MKPHIVKFFNFLEDKEGKNVPLRAKLLNPDKFKITKDDLIVKGDLNLSNTNIKSLPDDLQISGDLYLRMCTSLKSLPNDLQVSGTLFLTGCTSLKTLPNGLKVGWNLYLRNTSIAKMYSKNEIRDIIEAKGGYVDGTIYI